MPYKSPEAQKKAQHDHYMRNRLDYNRRNREWKRRRRLRRKPEAQFFLFCEIGVSPPLVLPCPGCGEHLKAAWGVVEDHCVTHTDAESARFFDFLELWQEGMKITSGGPSSGKLPPIADRPDLP
jgi:hypothetical protein